MSSLAGEGEAPLVAGAGEDGVAKTAVMRLGTVRVGSEDSSLPLWQVGLVGGRGLPPGIVLDKTCVTCHSSQCNHSTAYKKAHPGKDGKFLFGIFSSLSSDLTNTIFQLRPGRHQIWYVSQDWSLEH